MQYAVARGAMRMLAEMGRHGQLDTMGISLTDFKKVTGQTAWFATDKQRIISTFNSMICGVLDKLGLPRFEMPAEYIAGAICIFIDPVNAHSACRFLENVPSASAMGRATDESEICTARQLFALVVQLYADPERSVARHMFEQRTGLKLEQEMKKGKERGDTNEEPKTRK